MTQRTLVIPDLILLNDYNGDFTKYFNAVYYIFEHDFIKSQPKYESLNVTAPKYPEVDNYNHTFYHITHEGEDEESREPDMRRMERIRFPKFYINNASHNEILIWENTRGKNTRVLLFNETESYVVILTKRNGYYLLCTAYLIEQEHSKKKMLKEYETYIKAKTA